MDDFDYDDIPDAIFTEAVEQWSPAMLREVTAATTPSLTELFRRDNETLWINAYPATRVVTETYPPVPLPEWDRRESVGLILETHVGPRGNITDVFYARTTRAVQLGWERRLDIYVDSGDPWDVPSVLDEGREMPF
jgi:hypothetical protein